MRSAPSSRITSPLRNRLPMMCPTSAAYSSGIPSRRGNGTPSPRPCSTSGRESIDHRCVEYPWRQSSSLLTPLRASSRATGNVSPTTPLFDAAYAACPICPSNAAIDAVLIITPRSPSASGNGIEPAHFSGGEPDHVERADQIDLDHAVECVQRHWPIAADHPSRGADAGTIDQNPGRPVKPPRAPPPSPPQPRRRRSHRSLSRRRRSPRPAPLPPCH